jgi:hypothetical protein
MPAPEEEGLFPPLLPGATWGARHEPTAGSEDEAIR